MARIVKLRSRGLPNSMVGGFASTRRDSAPSLIKLRVAPSGGLLDLLRVPFWRVGLHNSVRALCNRYEYLFRRWRSLLQFFGGVGFPGFLSAQFCLDKHVDVAIHHGLNIARLGAGPVVFHHLIWLKHV
jgi:hypothetical protein